MPMAPPRSVLFNQPQPNWDLGSALLARQRDAAALDAGAQELGAGELPRSKSGAPFAPPNPAFAPLLSFEPPQWLDIAHWLSPNIVDYFTKTPPPAPPFPAISGKIPSTDNPYAGAAALEAATWVPLDLERIAAAPLMAMTGIAGKAAKDAALQAAKEAAKGALAPGTLERLQVHVDNADARLGEVGLTPNQLKSLERRPGFEAAHKGERIDTFAKETVAKDKNLAHLKITPRFRYGPDFYDPVNKVWFDATTIKEWARHQKKYADEFGNGIPLFYGDE